MLPAVTLFGLGMTVTVSPLTAAVLGAVERRRAGVASAVNNVAARLAGLLGIAVIPAVAGIDTGGRPGRQPRHRLSGRPADLGRRLRRRGGPRLAVRADVGVGPVRHPPGSALARPATTAALRLVAENAVRCPGDPAAYPFTHQLRVRFCETDAMACGAPRLLSRLLWRRPGSRPAADRAALTADHAVDRHGGGARLAAAADEIAHWKVAPPAADCASTTSSTQRR